MKKYVDNFMQYRFLLSELVKKGVKLKIQTFLSGNDMVYAGAASYHDRAYNCIWYFVWKYRQDFSCIYLTGRLLYSFFSQSTKPL